MNWLRRQFNEILGLFFLSFGITPTDEMKEQLGIAKETIQTNEGDAKTTNEPKDEQA